MDSILIDEARTPLIISGQADTPTDHYYGSPSSSPAQAGRGLYRRREGTHRLHHGRGRGQGREVLGVDNLYDEAALRADALPQPSAQSPSPLQAGPRLRGQRRPGHHRRRVHRPPHVGRRYSDGLHQSIEAKENVKIERKARLWLRSPFRTTSACTRSSPDDGTAKTEETEFEKIYGMDVVVIPTNLPMIRQDLPDLVYKTEAAKFDAVVEDIVEQHKRRAAGLGRHHFDRKVGAPLEMLKQARASPTRSSTPSTTRKRRRSSPRRAGSAPSPSPPTWQGEAPTSSSAATPSSWPRRSCAKRDCAGADADGGASRRNADSARRVTQRAQERSSRQRRRTPNGRKSSRSAASTFWARSATRAGASTTSSGAGRAGKATRARPASTSRWKTT